MQFSEEIIIINDIPKKALNEIEYCGRSTEVRADSHMALSYSFHQAPTVSGFSTAEDAQGDF